MRKYRWSLEVTFVSMPGRGVFEIAALGEENKKLERNCIRTECQVLLELKVFQAVPVEIHQLFPVLRALKKGKQPIVDG